MSRSSVRASAFAVFVCILLAGCGGNSGVVPVSGTLTYKGKPVTNAFINFVPASGGRPSIRGLRVRVKDILELLAAGVSREEILADYPYLEDGDITAALEYAAQQNDHPVLRAH